MTVRALSVAYAFLWWLTLALGALAIGLSPAADGALSRIEGARWPVVAPAVLTRIEPAGPTHARIWGHAVKLRGCRFLGVEWALTAPDGAVPVAVTFEDRAVIRPRGAFDFGPWLVGLPAEAVARESVAFAVHKCHPGWPVRSLFWSPAP